MTADQPEQPDPDGQHWGRVFGDGGPAIIWEGDGLEVVRLVGGSWAWNGRRLTVHPATDGHDRPT